MLLRDLLVMSIKMRIEDCWAQECFFKVQFLKKLHQWNCHIVISILKLMNSILQVKILFKKENWENLKNWIHFHRVIMFQKNEEEKNSRDTSCLWKHDLYMFFFLRDIKIYSKTIWKMKLFFMFLSSSFQRDTFFCLLFSFFLPHNNDQTLFSFVRKQKLQCLYTCNSLTDQVGFLDNERYIWMSWCLYLIGANNCGVKIFFYLKIY